VTSIVRVGDLFGHRSSARPIPSRAFPCARPETHDATCHVAAGATEVLRCSAAVVAGASHEIRLFELSSFDEPLFRQKGGDARLATPWSVAVVIIHRTGEQQGVAVLAGGSVSVRPVRANETGVGRSLQQGQSNELEADIGRLASGERMAKPVP
jgi:hypothetical protein